MRDLAPFA